MKIVHCVVVSRAVLPAYKLLHIRLRTTDNEGT